MTGARDPSATESARAPSPASPPARDSARPVRRGLRVACASVLALTALALLGPRVQVDEALPAGPIVPRDADPVAWLARRESAVPGIKPGNAAVIQRAHPRRRTPLALVYLHGFSASPAEVSPLCEDLATGLGANLVVPRLRGHGRDGEAMLEGTASAWIRDGLIALELAERLGDRVVLIGTSTGATLAVWLASQPELQDRIHGLILLSPNFGPRDPRAALLTLPWGFQLTRAIAGRMRSFTPVNDEQRKFWTTRYRSEALVEMMALVEVTVAAPLEQIPHPVLVLHTADDRVVSTEKIVATAARIGRARSDDPPVTRELVETADPGSHLLAGRVLSPKTTPAVRARLAEFLQQHGLTGTAGARAPSQEQE